MKNYLAISLVISSETASANSISERVGLTPTSTRLRGTPIKPGVLRRPEFDLREWWLRDELEVHPGGHLEEMQRSFVSEFLDKLGVAAERIRNLADHCNVMIVLVYHLDRVPYIGLTGQQVQKIAALGASIDVDLMIGEV